MKCHSPNVRARDKFGVESERDAPAAEFERKAIATLDDPIAKGFTDIASIHTDPDFAPLATMPGFAEREARAAER